MLRRAAGGYFRLDVRTIDSPAARSPARIASAAAMHPCRLSGGTASRSPPAMTAAMTGRAVASNRAAARLSLAARRQGRAPSCTKPRSEARQSHQC
jgi:hypothetical protein